MAFVLIDFDDKSVSVVPSSKVQGQIELKSRVSVKWPNKVYAGEIIAISDDESALNSECDKLCPAPQKQKGVSKEPEKAISVEHDISSAHGDELDEQLVSMVPKKAISIENDTASAHGDEENEPLDTAAPRKACDCATKIEQTLRAFQTTLLESVKDTIRAELKRDRDRMLLDEQSDAGKVAIVERLGAVETAVLQLTECLSDKARERKLQRFREQAEALQETTSPKPPFSDVYREAMRSINEEDASDSAESSMDHTGSSRIQQQQSTLSLSSSEMRDLTEPYSLDTNHDDSALLSYSASHGPQMALDASLENNQENAVVESMVVTSTPVIKRRKLAVKPKPSRKHHLCMPQCMTVTAAAPSPGHANDAFYLGGESMGAVANTFIVSRDLYKSMIEQNGKQAQRVALKLLGYLFTDDELKVGSFSGKPRHYAGKTLEYEQLCPVRLQVLRKQLQLDFPLLAFINDCFPTEIGKAITGRCRGLRFDGAASVQPTSD